MSANAIELRIDGMTCANCVRHVDEALRGVPGVRAVRVDLESGRAVVELEPPATLAALREAVERAGYAAAEA